VIELFLRGKNREVFMIKKLDRIELGKDSGLVGIIGDKTVSLGIPKLKSMSFDFASEDTPKKDSEGIKSYVYRMINQSATNTEGEKYFRDADLDINRIGKTSQIKVNYIEYPGLES
jgi:hypothetical protein